MKTLASLACVVLVVTALGSTTVHARPPMVVSGCGAITSPGNYVLANDLVIDTDIDPAGDCLDISAAHVNLNLEGHTIYVDCLLDLGTSCGVVYGASDVGAIGINILKGADHVSITNGTVGSEAGNFEYGIAGAADYTSVAEMTLVARVGISLTNASYNTFTGISYTRGDDSYHGADGPIVSVSGNHNTFTSVVSGFNGFVGSDLNHLTTAISVEGDHNLIDQANVSSFGVGSYTVLLSGNYNSITNSTVFGEGNGGIEVTLGGAHNYIEGNTVTILNPAFFAMFDQNPDCGSNIWTGNTFSNASPISADPSSCIR